VCRGDCEGGFVCDETPRACTDDLATYCGCDGAVFYDSGSCPSHAYQNRGSCKGEAPLTFNCDERDIICQTLVAPEPCPEGEAYSVENGCHGSCVPISQCGCESADECPDPENKDEFTCLLSEQHCSYWLR